MKDYRSNVAYDLSMYEPKPKKEEQKPQIKVIKSKNTAKYSTGTIIKGALVTILIVSITSVLLYNNLILNELSAEISRQNKKLDVLMSEKTRLSMELESKVNLKNVEDIAINELGLKKVDNQQIEYVQIANSNGVVQSKNNSKQSFFDIIKSGIAKIKEYLG